MWLGWVHREDAQCQGGTLFPKEGGRLRCFTPTVQRKKGKEGWKETFLNHQRSWVEGSEKTL